jgi:hypothetical protein
MKPVALVVVGLFFGISAFAEEGKLCSTEFLDISNNGRTIALSQQGSTQFEMEKTAKGYSLTPKALSTQYFRQKANQSVLERVDLDDQGKAKKILLKGNEWGFAEPVYTVYELDYKNGRCYVKSKVRDRQLVANTQLCRSLAGILEEQKKCDDKTDKAIWELFKKYNASMNDTSPMRTYGPLAEAGRHIGICETDPSLAGTFGEDSLWNGTGTKKAEAAR